MSTFLQLVQETERESGTISQPLTTVLSQTGRHAMFVRWVRDAWSLIQSERTSWGWQRADWQQTLFVGVDAYSPEDMGLAPRFKAWVFDTETGRDISIYDPSVGQASEGFLTPVEWSAFRRTYLVGAAVEKTGIPTLVARDAGQKLHLWPTPDKAYILRGEYFKGSQTLAADADVPELPVEYHAAIKYKALILMAVYDEAPGQIPSWMEHLTRLMKGLEETQLPRFRMGAPLA